MFDPQEMARLAELDEQMRKVETMHLRDRPVARNFVIFIIILISMPGIVAYYYLGDSETLLLPGILILALFLEGLYYRRAVRISMDNITNRLEKGFVGDPKNIPELVSVFNALRLVLDWNLHWYTRQRAENKFNNTKQTTLKNLFVVLENATKENGAQEDPSEQGIKILHVVDVNKGFFHPAVVLMLNNGTLHVKFTLVVLNGNPELCFDHVINLPPELKEKIYKVLITAWKSLGNSI